MSEWLRPVVEAYRALFPGLASWIVDVGSRDGDDAAYLVSELGGTATCIEARSEAAENIAARYPDFQVIAAAVGADTGWADFLEYLGPDDNMRGSSTFNLARADMYPEPHRIIQVPVLRLDTILRPGTIDVLKIDVEGFTLQALHGLGDRIRDVMVAHLETETAERAAWHEPANNREVADFMSSHGFDLYSRDYQWGPSIEDQTWVRSLR